MRKGGGNIVEMNLYRRFDRAVPVAPYERGVPAPDVLTRPRAANDDHSMTCMDRLKASMPRFTIFN